LKGKERYPREILAGKSTFLLVARTFFDAHSLVVLTTTKRLAMFASTALHKLIQTQSWDSVEERIASHPSEVRKLAVVDALRDPLRKSKALPLHHAVAQDPPKEVVEMLITSYDKAIGTTETAYHRTVLHIACMNRADSSVIETVFRRYSPAIKIQDSLSRLPIHYAIANGCKVSTLKLLLDEFPESAAVPDHRNWLPLHIACGMRAPLTVIQLVLAKNPEAVLALDEDGHSPLALAKRNVIPKRAVDVKVVAFLQHAMQQELKKRGLSNPDACMVAPVPQFVTLDGAMMEDDLKSSGVSKASTLSSANSTSTAKKGIFRRRR
jgi:hypothetical protein